MLYLKQYPYKIDRVLFRYHLNIYKSNYQYDIHGTYHIFPNQELLHL
uniref:Uncharacterized protein n=1 Tax=Klebsiella pneumoniae TaxID=573 RepID=A0A3S6QAH9_KLEPN|nr:hypothetical protein CN886_0026 [Klebsiella pneumoniae]